MTCITATEFFSPLFLLTQSTSMACSGMTFYLFVSLHNANHSNELKYQYVLMLQHSNFILFQLLSMWPDELEVTCWTPMFQTARFTQTFACLPDSQPLTKSNFCQRVNIMPTLWYINHFLHSISPAPTQTEPILS